MIIKASEAQELVELCDNVVDMLEDYGVEPDLKLVTSYMQACDVRQLQSSFLGLFLCSSVRSQAPERGKCKMQ
jgi:hypothetical protein